MAKDFEKANQPPSSKLLLLYSHSIARLTSSLSRL